MKQKGFIAPLIIFIILFISVVILAMDWAIVDVRTLQPEKIHIIAPLPISLAKVVLHFVPIPDEKIDMPPEVVENKKVVLNALRILADSPDALFVKVNSREANVTITKKKDQLLVEVKAPDATVSARIPLKTTLKMLKKWDWKSIEPEVFIEVFDGFEKGEILNVDTKEARVKIRKW
jgi:hypothetical protein